MSLPYKRLGRGPWQMLVPSFEKHRRIPLVAKAAYIKQSVICPVEGNSRSPAFVKQFWGHIDLGKLSESSYLTHFQNFLDKKLTNS